MQSATPEKLLSPVWPLSLSLATTYKISVDFSSSPYLDVSVQEVPLIYLCIQYMIYELRILRRLSYKERRVDALALRAEERRDKLRKATGRCK